MKIRTITQTGVLIALTVVATMFIRIPNPATQGYINLGDSMIFTIAVVFGWRVGGLSGGVGSALADMISGYFLWSPWTLIIKGVEGCLVGILAWWGHRRFSGWRDQVVSGSAIFVGGIWMVLGYYMAGTALFGSIVALTEIPGNLVQAGVGLMAALPLSILLRRALKRSYYGSDAY